MKMHKPLYLLLTLIFLPSVLGAQEIAIGGRAGTLGFGAEAALGLSDNISLRGGLGSFIFEFDGDLDDVGFTVSPPSMTGTLGVDFYPSGGSFRLIGGLMFRDGDFTMDSEDISESGSINLGGTEYTESGTLHGTIATKSTAPFVGIGFGNHTQGGFGFFLDLGVAFVGAADVTLEAEGPIANVDGIDESLALEAQDFEDEVGSYLKYWPILNLGVKIPIG
jgi:hypothetical protein